MRLQLSHKTAFLGCLLTRIIVQIPPLEFQNLHLETISYLECSLNISFSPKSCTIS